MGHQIVQNSDRFREEKQMNPRIAPANTLKIFTMWQHRKKEPTKKDSGSLSEFKKWRAVSKNVKAAKIHWQNMERRKS